LAAYAAGRLDEAAKLYGAAAAIDPNDFRAPYSLAVIALRRGRFAEAEPGFAAVTERAPDNFAAWHNLGACRQSLKRWEGAAEAFARALALRPDAAETRFALAGAQAVLGRTDEAAEAYRLLARDPAQRERALLRRAVLAPDAVDDAELAALEAALAAARGDGRIPLTFAVAAVRDARGQDEAAFAAYALGNRLKHEALAESRPDRRPAAVQATYDRAAAAAQARPTPEPLAPIPGPAPIFIVGFPRCGSTLVEQILASHPDVRGLGETAAFGLAIERSLPEGAPPPIQIMPGFLEAVRDDYLGALAAAGWDGMRRPVDKTLENHLHLDLIRAAFPRAVILHCVRDAVETGVGCWRQLFSSGNETLYDLGDIARAWRAYRGVMDHWAATTPGMVVEVDHDRLTAAPEAQIRWLVSEVCGLTWHPACLSFHRTERPVESASAAQVRRPIFRPTPYRERYAGRLGPLLEGLGPYA
jgi:tetratricopeptide (TPR) repeat protein